jgi:hypothetical protein
MQQSEILIDKDSKTVPAPHKDGQLLADNDDKGIHKVKSRTLSFIGHDVTLRPREGSSGGAHTLKNYRIELPDPQKTPYKGPERRRDLLKRKRVEEMTREEMRKELLEQASLPGRPEVGRSSVR